MGYATQSLPTVAGVTCCKAGLTMHSAHYSANAALQGTYDLVWSAVQAVELGQPASSTQASIHLAAAMPAAEVQPLVEAWLKDEAYPASWQDAAITVRQASSGVLHLLFYMPEPVHRKLQDLIRDMLVLGDQSTACAYFKDDLYLDLMAFTAIRDMLQREGLNPEEWKLSTAYLGKVVNVGLLTGTYAHELFSQMMPLVR